MSCSSLYLLVRTTRLSQSAQELLDEFALLIAWLQLALLQSVHFCLKTYKKTGLLYDIQTSNCILQSFSSLLLEQYCETKIYFLIFILGPSDAHRVKIWVNQDIWQVSWLWSIMNLNHQKISYQNYCPKISSWEEMKRTLVVRSRKKYPIILKVDLKRSLEN